MDRARFDAVPPLHVLLATLGSAGDVHPVIALGLALQRRGHRATVLTNPLFEPLIGRVGLGFLPVGSLEQVRAAIADPRLWHPRKGLGYVLQLVGPAIRAIYETIMRIADAHTVVVGSSLALGVRVAQERHGIPTATLHLQPSLLRSAYDTGLVGPMRFPSWQPRWLKRSLFGVLDALMVDPHICKPLNALRSELGLAPVTRVFDGYVHSPQCVLGLFPEWFATPQPDWPAQTHLLGFALWDGEGNGGSSAEEKWSGVGEFLQAGAPPVVITPGSAAAHMQRYFAESLRAVCELGMRAMLVTNYPEQLPRELPPGVAVHRYVPFSRLLPHAALLVHHGGIGTLAQAVHAGVPQLIVPNAYDQFDNGWRLQRLGLGQTRQKSHYRGSGLAAQLRELLSDPSLRERCRNYSSRIDTDGALTRGCELIEGLATGSHNAHGCTISASLKGR